MASIETMDQQAIDEMKTTYKSSGPSGLLSSLKSKLNRWKNNPLHIAIIGNSGAGKSSYINAIRGLDADDEGSAAVGETETTVGDPISYKDPRNDNLLYWDLPGVGTTRYPRDTYLRQVGFDKFDFYILISSSRFTENDLWLAKEIEKAGKQFFFLRSKIDDALANEKRAHRKTYNREATLDKIRKNCESELKKGGVKTVDVFLISSYETALFDFDRAKEKLLKDFPKLKKDAMVLSVSHGHSSEILKEKTEVLRGRILKIGIGSCLTNAVPVVSFLCDVTLIKSEVDFYIKQLSLDDISLEQLAELADVSSTSLKSKRGLYSFDDIANKLEEKKGTVRSYLTLIPLVGSIANVDAGAITAEVLTDILNGYEKAALEILESTQKAVAKKAADELDI